MTELHPDLQREIIGLGQALREQFAPAEFIPGCLVKSVADKDLYAANNGWIEAICGKHNQQRCRWKSSNAVAVNDYIDVIYFASGKIFEVWGVGGSTAIPPASGWPFAQILSVSTTDTGADHPTLAAAAAVANNQTILLDSETYSITSQSLPNTITLTGVLGQTVISGSVAGGATLTIANISTFFRFLRVSHTGGNAGGGGSTVAGAILTDQDGTFLERLIIRKTSGAPTTAYGVHITGGASLGSYLLDCDISVTSGTSRYGVLIDTAASITVIDGGEYNSTADILVNHASAVVLLKGPRLRGGGLTVTAGTVTGWYIDASGFTVNVTGLNFDVTKGLQGGVWREATGGRRVRETSLATAITNASAGDVIWLYPGTYTGAITVNKAITIRGTSPNEVILTQSTNDTPTVTITAAGVTLMDLTVNSTGGGSSSAALYNDQNGFLAINCFFNKVAGAPTNGACVSTGGGVSTFRDCAAVSTSGTSKYAYSLGGGTATIDGGSATGANGDVLTVTGSILILNGPRLLGGGLNTSNGGTVSGWYIDANGKVINLNGSHSVMPSLPNGDLLVWHVATSYAAIADATYFATNWIYMKSSVAVHTVSQSSDVPTVAQAGRLINYSALTDCTTIDATISAGEYVMLRTALEGYDWLDYAQVGFPFSFWHKHTKTGTYCVAFQNGGHDRSFVAEYTQAVTDTWELATVFVLPSPTAGTWNYTNGAGLYVYFPIAAGSTYQTTALAWQTGNFVATSNQVNGVDSTANNFMIALVGNVPDVSSERKLARCQRYLYVPDASQVSVDVLNGAKVTGASISVTGRFPVPMRAAPTFSHNITGYTAGTPGTTTIGVIDYGNNAFSTLTGALTVSLAAASTEIPRVTLGAGTSWTGTNGQLFGLRLGPDVRLQFSSQL